MATCWRSGRLEVPDLAVRLRVGGDGHVDARAPPYCDPPDRRENLDRLARHRAACAEDLGQTFLGGQPVAGLQVLLRDVRKQLLGDQLVAGAIGGSLGHSETAVDLELV